MQIFCRNTNEGTDTDNHERYLLIWGYSKFWFQIFWNKNVIFVKQTRNRCLYIKNTIINEQQGTRRKAYLNFHQSDTTIRNHSGHALKKCAHIKKKQLVQAANYQHSCIPKSLIPYGEKISRAIRRQWQWNRGKPSKNCLATIKSSAPNRFHRGSSTLGCRFTFPLLKYEKPMHMPDVVLTFSPLVPGALQKVSADPVCSELG